MLCASHNYIALMIRKLRNLRANILQWHYTVSYMRKHLSVSCVTCLWIKWRDCGYSRDVLISCSSMFSSSHTFQVWNSLTGITKLVWHVEIHFSFIVPMVGSRRDILDWFYLVWSILYWIISTFYCYSWTKWSSY